MITGCLGQRLLGGAEGPRPLLELYTAQAGGVNTDTDITFWQKHTDAVKDQSAYSPDCILVLFILFGYEPNCVPSKFIVEVLVPDVILFGDGVFKKISKVKRGRKDGGPNPIGPLCLREKKTASIYMHRGKAI